MQGTLARRSHPRAPIQEHAAGAHAYHGRFSPSPQQRSARRKVDKAVSCRHTLAVTIRMPVAPKHARAQTVRQSGNRHRPLVVTKPSVLLRGVAAVLVGLLLPLAGVWVTGQPLLRYWEFPPRHQYLQPASFRWPVFVALAVTEAWVLRFLLRHLRPVFVSPARHFPAWGWLGVAAMGAMWVLAWTRFEWFAPFQPHTFTPLWLSYIVVVNALTCRQAGRCLLVDEWRRLPSLFAASAAFWWFFEYLNRFVQNWRYLGIDSFTPLEYLFFASCAYATVLPAVLSTEEYLHAVGYGKRADQHRLSRLKAGRRRLLMAASAISLMLVGIFPAILFPLLWLAPLGVAWGLMEEARPLGRRPSLGTVVRLAAAALVCGFFWELWNWHSLAKWVYSVSYVGRFKLFEMPVLGYFGYLSFGWECGLMAAFLPQWRAFLLRRWP